MGGSGKNTVGKIDTKKAPPPLLLNNNTSTTNPGNSSTTSTTTPTTPTPPTTNTPSSLYSLAAVLLASEIITIKDLLPYLQPSVQQTAEILITLEKNLVNEIKSHGAGSLNTDNSSQGISASAGVGGNVMKAFGAAVSPPIPLAPYPGHPLGYPIGK